MTKLPSPKWLRSDALPDVLNLNEPAPDFTLPADNGEQVTLSQFQGQQPVLIFFYPGDFTPVCTAEVCAFRDDYENFRTRHITILGISADPVEKHHRFSQECRVPFRLLSDTNLTVARLFGAKGLLGMRRAYYLVGRDGKLLWQHTEILPVFRLCNTRILEAIDKHVPLPKPAASQPSGYIPPPHL